jgi:hypothetical protein
MKTRTVTWALVGSLGALSAWAAVAAKAGSDPKLDVTQILERCTAARGGADAWAKVQSMVWSGHVDRADRSGPKPQFVLEQKRPNLTRFEVVLDGQRSVRVFDGRQGWKLRPNASGRPDLLPYTEEEESAARDALVIDGPVLGAKAKGVELKLEGVDEVEGHPAYRLSTTLPSGAEHRVWIDAKSFLEVKWDRPGLDAAGRPTRVAVYLRNYQAFEGVQLPFTIETGAPDGGPGSERLVIERIAINPNLPDGAFARPSVRPMRRGVTVDTRAAAGGPRVPPAAWSRVAAPSASAVGALGRSGSAP